MTFKIKLLIVDDEAQFRATTKKILDRRGFDTILAGSGEEAIEMLESNPDVVVLDIKMPGMDGHETLKEIKNRSPKTPVIMLTGHGDMPSAKQALKGGAFDYLSKPCDIDILTAKVLEAHRNIEKIAEENAVGDIMIPIEEYTTLTEEHTIQEAIEVIRSSFYPRLSTSRIMETGHRSLLVMDSKNNVTGVVAIIDLLQIIMPPYLSAPKPSMADSMQYSTMFWKGEFKRSIKKLADKKLGDIMAPPPLTIDYDANLMEASYAMVSNKERRLVVLKKGKVVGVIREQDLFFEIERIIRER
jgi:CheY-like chemotaxis protein/predicted transcriptional regulator